MKVFLDITGRPPHSSGKKGTSVAVNMEGKLLILHPLRLTSPGGGGRSLTALLLPWNGDDMKT